MHDPTDTIQWETDLASLLGDLSTAQDELLEVLRLKRDRMAKTDLAGMEGLSSREQRLAGQLRHCHERRKQMLQQAATSGMPSRDLGHLAAAMPARSRDSLDQQLKTVSSKMRILQHQSLANWVIAQRSLLHLSQLLEIIATGGRIKPTYGKDESDQSRGALVDRAV